MNTIDEAIKHCEEVAEYKEAVCKTIENEEGEFTDNNTYYKYCKRRAKEHRQLADWLKELKTYRNAITEMKKWINSNNRGNADYFIVDKIEGIIEEINADEDSD